MKKFVMGLIIGAFLMCSTQVFAAGISYLGKKVDGQVDVQVDGKVIGKAVIIQGKSFAPVRDIVTSMGGSVDSTTGGVISLSTNESLSIATDSNNTEVADELNKKVRDQQAVVDRIAKMVADLQQKVDTLTAQGIDPTTQKIELKLMNDQLAKETTTLENLKSQLAELQK